MAIDASVPAWLTDPNASWMRKQEGTLGSFIGGIASGYNVAQKAGERRAINKGVDAYNEAFIAMGKAGLIPESAVEGMTMPRIKGNWFTDTIDAITGKGSEEAYMDPASRAVFNLKKDQLATDQAYKFNSIINQRARTKLAQDAALNKERLALLTEGGVESFTEKWNELTSDGRMGTPEALAELQSIVGSNPAIAGNQFVLQGLRMAEDAIQLKQPKPGEGTAQMKNDQYAQGLLDEADYIESAGFTEEAKQLRSRAESVKASGRLYDRDQPLEIEQIVGEGGRIHEAIRLPSGGIKMLPYVDETKVSPMDLATYKSELTALQRAWRDYDPIILTNNKPDVAKYQKMKQDLYERFSKKPKGESAPEKPAASPSAATKMRFDPATRRLLDADGKPIEFK